MNKRNLTEGSVLSSLLTLSIPIIFANMLQVGYQLIDTFWVGRLGSSAVAAVSISFPIIFLLVSLGAGMALAGAILVAQYKGKNEQNAINHIATQTLLMVFFASFVLSILGYFVSPFLVRLMGAAPDVYSQAVSYLKISFIGIIFLFIYFVFQSLMRGVGNVKVPMFIVLGTVLLNLFLDPLFIFGYKSIPGFGVAGAALASVITQALSAFIGLFLLFRKNKDIYIHIKGIKPDFKLIKKMFNLSFPSMIEQSSRAFSMVAIVFLVTSFGTIATAAYGVGSKILSLVTILTIGLSTATATLVGQNMGADKIKRAQEVVRISISYAFFTLMFLGIIMFIFAKQFSSFFIPGEIETINESTLFIKVMAFAFGFTGIRQVLNGVFRGAGDTLTSMTLSIISLWVLRFPLAYILSRHTDLNQAGIWLAFPIANIVGMTISIIWFSRGTWKEKKLTKEIKISSKVSEESIVEEGIQ